MPRKISSQKKLTQWLVNECKCEEVMATRISKRFIGYYSKIVHGTRFPQEPEGQAKNIILAFAAGYLRGINENE
jgi:hypothetical protein